MRIRLTMLAGAALLAPAMQAAALPGETPRLATDPAQHEYRRIHVQVQHRPGPDVRSYQVWFSGQPFDRTADAELHSTLMIGNTKGLNRTAPAFDTQDCRTAGQPVHRNANDIPVLAPDTLEWFCSLSGMPPGTDQWIAVLPVDADGRGLSPLRPIRARTDVADQRPPPPDTLPITLTLGAIVLSAIILLSYLRRRDIHERPCAVQPRLPVRRAGPDRLGHAHLLPGGLWGVAGLHRCQPEPPRRRGLDRA